MFVVGGESLIDLVSDGPDEDGNLRFVSHAGGSPYNCAIALSKLNNPTGFLCPFSTDSFGDVLLGPLEAAGVTRLMQERIKAPSTLAVVSFEGKHPRYRFYREADRAFTVEGLLAALPEKVELFQVGGFCPIIPADAEAWLTVAEECQRRGALISIDPNLRPFLIDDLEAYKQRLSRFLDIAHLIKVSDEDLNTLDPGKSIEDHVKGLLARPNCELVIVTLSQDGSRAFTKSAEARAGIYSPMIFGDTVGAGDTLMAGILGALADRTALSPARLGALDGEALGEVLRFGAIVAGLNCAYKGCVPPSRAEVDSVLGSAD